MLKVLKNRTTILVFSVLMLLFAIWQLTGHVMESQFAGISLPVGLIIMSIVAIYLYVPRKEQKN